MRVHVRMTKYISSGLLFVMSIRSFGCFPFRFRGRDFGSDCVSSWSLLTFFVSGVRFDDVFNFPFCERTVYSVYRINAISI